MSYEPRSPQEYVQIVLMELGSYTQKQQTEQHNLTQPLQCSSNRIQRN